MEGISGRQTAAHQCASIEGEAICGRIIEFIILCRQVLPGTPPPSRPRRHVAVAAVQHCHGTSCAENLHHASFLPPSMVPWLTVAHQLDVEAIQGAIAMAFHVWKSAARHLASIEGQAACGCGCCTTSCVWKSSAKPLASHGSAR
jgi:hypothetical protein